MSDNQCPLLGEVVVDVGDDLHCHVRFSRSGWTDHHGQSGLHASSDRLGLRRGERDRIPGNTISDY